MDYDKYKQEYKRHTDLIENFDGLIATNDKERQKADGELKTAEDKQNALSGKGTAPENVDIAALESADADAQRLRASVSDLDQKGLDLRSGRNEVFNAREELKNDNPDMEADRVTDSLPPLPEERGVGVLGKSALIPVVLAGSAQDVQNLTADNLNSHPPAIVSEYQPPEQSNASAASQDPPSEQAQHAQGQKEDPHKEGHPGHDHTPEQEFDTEDRRQQTTTTVESDPPPPGDAPKPTATSGKVGPPYGQVTVTVTHDPPPDAEAPHEAATPRPPDPEDTISTQTYEVKPGGSFSQPMVVPGPDDEPPAPPGKGNQPGDQPLAPPKDTEPPLITSGPENQKLLTDQRPSVPNGNQPGAQPLAPPKDSEQLLITSDRENQKLVTDQRPSASKGDQPGAEALGPPKDLDASPSGPSQGGSPSAAPAIQPPKDDIPSPGAESSAPPPSNDIQM